jgi:hypothetical protein
MLKNVKIAQKAVLMLTLAGLVCGCATSQKIPPVQIGDNQLSKQEIVCEMDKLVLAEQQIASKKGVTGTNVAAALFWVPGLAYTYYDAGEAMRLIEQRRAHLTSLYNQKMANEGHKKHRQG